MTTTSDQQTTPRPYLKTPDEELDALQQSIMHSVIQGESSISFWNQELRAIRHERKARKQQAQPVAEGGEA